MKDHHNSDVPVKKDKKKGGKGKTASGEVSKREIR